METSDENDTTTEVSTAGADVGISISMQPNPSTSAEAEGKDTSVSSTPEGEKKTKKGVTFNKIESTLSVKPQSSKTGTEALKHSSISEDKGSERDAKKQSEQISKSIPQERRGSLVVAELPPYEGMRRQAVCGFYEPIGSVSRMPDFSELEDSQRKEVMEDEILLVKQSRLLEIFDRDFLNHLDQVDRLPGYNDPLRYYQDKAESYINRSMKKFAEIAKDEDGNVWNPKQFIYRVQAQGIEVLNIDPRDMAYRGSKGLQRLEQILNHDDSLSYLENNLKRRFYNLNIPKKWLDRVFELRPVIKTLAEKEKEYYMEIFLADKDFSDIYNALTYDDMKEKYYNTKLKEYKKTENQLEPPTKKQRLEEPAYEGKDAPPKVEKMDIEECNITNPKQSYDDVEEFVRMQEEEWDREEEQPSTSKNKIKSNKGFDSSEDERNPKKSKSSKKDRKHSNSKDDEDPSDSEDDDSSDDSSDSSSEEEETHKTKMSDSYKKIRKAAREEAEALTRNEQFIYTLTGNEDALALQISDLQNKEEFVEPKVFETISVKGKNSVSTEIKFYQLENTGPETIRSFIYYHFKTHDNILNLYNILLECAAGHSGKKKKKAKREAKTTKSHLMTSLTDYNNRLSSRVKTEIKLLIGAGTQHKVTKFQIWEYLLSQVREEHRTGNYTVNDFIGEVREIRQKRWKKNTDHLGPKVTHEQIIKDYYVAFELLKNKYRSYNSSLEEEQYSKIFLGGIYFNLLRMQSIIWIAEAIKTNKTVTEGLWGKPKLVTMDDMKTIYNYLCKKWRENLDSALAKEHGVLPSHLLQYTEANFNPISVTPELMALNDIVHRSRAKPAKIEKTRNVKQNNKREFAKERESTKRTRPEKRKRESNKKKYETISADSEESEEKPKEITKPKGSGKPCIICNKPGHKSIECTEKCFCGWEIIIPSKEERKEESCVKHDPFECHANEYNINTYKGRKHNNDGKCEICSDKSLDKLREYLKKYRTRKFHPAAKPASSTKKGESKDKKSKDNKKK